MLAIVLLRLSRASFTGGVHGSAVEHLHQVHGSAVSRFIRHPPDSRAFWATFGPVGACRNEIRAVADCADSQIVGLTAPKRWNASLGLYQGTLRLSSFAASAPAGSSCRRWRRA